MTAPEPARRPRLVATDLDGTLLRSDGTLSDYTRRVIAATDEAGVPVVFVTGRPLRWMHHLWDAVGAHGLAILGNGAIVFDVAAREVRTLHGFAPDPGLAVAERIRAAVPGVELGLEDLEGLLVENGFEGHRAGVRVGPFAEHWRAPAVKLLARHTTMPPEELQAAVVAAVGDDATATWSMPGLVEISAAGVTKAFALARVCAELGIDAADVVAFGDMPNDLPMLGWAGTGIAVANAHEQVRAAADRTAPANDEDGVARTVAPLVGLTGDLVSWEA
ncbi:HAD family hydrolase [Nocardioides sp.]|uniref:HAD family hydrolase n=1 Tax=Nocardioides sp. TaxID=35761 RepID=UPI003515B2D8